MEEPDAVKRLERMREQALAGKKTTPTRNLWFLTDKGCNWLETQDSATHLPHLATRGNSETADPASMT